MPHDHDEGEVDQTKADNETDVKKNGLRKQIWPRASRPDQECKGNLDEDRAIGPDGDQPVLPCQQPHYKTIVKFVGGKGIKE